MHINPTWEPIGDADPLTRLLATIIVGNCHMHLEARQVVTTDGVQAFIEYPEDYEALCVLYDAAGSGGFQTMTRDGRDYVLFAVPFSS